MKKSLFHLYFWKIFSLSIEFQVDRFCSFNILLPSHLHCFWQEISCHMSPYSYVCKHVFFFFSFGVFEDVLFITGCETLMMGPAEIFTLLLLGVCSAPCICTFILCNKFENFSMVISSNIFSVSLLSLLLQRLQLHMLRPLQISDNLWRLFF